MEMMNGIVDNIPNISVITKIEVLGFNAADEHYQLLTNFISDSRLFDLNNDIVEISINIVKNTKQSYLMQLLQQPQWLTTLF